MSELADGCLSSEVLIGYSVCNMQNRNLTEILVGKND